MGILRTLRRLVIGPLRPRIEDIMAVDEEEMNTDREHDFRMRRIAESRQRQIDEALRHFDREIDIRVRKPRHGTNSSS